MKTFCLFVVVLVAAFHVSPASAGECIPQTISHEYIERTDLIFEGQLSENSSADIALESMEDILTITKLWKGEESGDVTITQSRYHGRGFYSGRKYLVFADKSSDGSYSTSGCEVIVEITDEKPSEISYLESYFNKIKKAEKE